MINLLNNWMIRGFIGVDVEVKTSTKKEKKQYCRIGLVEDRSYSDTDNKWHEKTAFHNLVAFSDTVLKRITNSKLKKGDEVIFSCEIQISVKEVNNQNVYSTRFVINHFDILHRKFIKKDKDKEPPKKKEPPADQKET